MHWIYFVLHTRRAAIFLSISTLFRGASLIEREREKFLREEKFIILININFSSFVFDDKKIKRLNFLNLSNHLI